MNEPNEYAWDAPGRLLAFVSDSCDSGYIIEAHGGFAAEVGHNGSRNIEDYDMPCPDNPGLQILEGWPDHGPGPDPDVHFIGQWRRLKHWEVCRLRYGMKLFSDSVVIRPVTDSVVIRS